MDMEARSVNSNGSWYSTFHSILLYLVTISCKLGHGTQCPCRSTSQNIRIYRNNQISIIDHCIKISLSLERESLQVYPAVMYHLTADVSEKKDVHMDYCKQVEAATCKHISDL